MVNGRTELVVWDWNGTILDDTQLCYDIADEMLIERGLKPLDGIEHYRTVFGFPVIDYYRRMGYRFETESYEDVSREFVRLYAGRVASCPLQPHAREVFAALRARGIFQVLLSATGEETLLSQLALFKLTDCFDRIIGMKDNLSSGKAEEARAFFESTHVAPEHALMIGDTDHDWAISRALGCRCALLIPGHQTRSRLDALSAPLIRGLDEVPGLL